MDVRETMSIVRSPPRALLALAAGLAFFLPPACAPGDDCACSEPQPEVFVKLGDAPAGGTVEATRVPVRPPVSPLPSQPTDWKYPFGMTVSVHGRRPRRSHSTSYSATLTEKSSSA